MNVPGIRFAAALALCACSTERPSTEGRPPLAAAPPDPQDLIPGTQIGWPYLPEVNANCLEPLGRTNSPPTRTSIADVVKAPQPVEYQSDAYVVFRGACHFGANKTGGACRPFVVLSDTRYAGIKAAMTPALDLVVFVDDSSKWQQFSQYRVNLGLCSFEPGIVAARVIGTPAAL